MPAYWRKYNESVNISTKDGNAVILSGEDCQEPMEALYLGSNPAMKAKIVGGQHMPFSKCLPETKMEKVGANIIGSRFDSKLA